MACTSLGTLSHSNVPLGPALLARTFSIFYTFYTSFLRWIVIFLRGIVVGIIDTGEGVGVVELEIVPHGLRIL